MNLIEKISFYATLVALRDQREAYEWLKANIEPELLTHVQACVNKHGCIINTRGTRFFFEDYEGVPQLPLQQKYEQ